MGKNKKATVLVNHELDGKIIQETEVPRPKMYSYLRDDLHVDKEAKITKKCFLKQKTKYQTAKKAPKIIKQC